MPKETDPFYAVLEFIDVFVNDSPNSVDSIQHPLPLPGGKGEFATITLISESRLGNNAHRLTTHTITVIKWVRSEVEIVVWSETGRLAMRHASLVELWANDPVGRLFFEKHGIRFVEATSPQPKPFEELPEDRAISGSKRAFIRFVLEHSVSDTVPIPCASLFAKQET